MINLRHGNLSIKSVGRNMHFTDEGADTRTKRRPRSNIVKWSVKDVRITRRKMGRVKVFDTEDGYIGMYSFINYRAKVQCAS